MEPIRANWPSGEDEFLLRIGELEALDDLTEAGVLDLRYRLSQGAQRGSLGSGQTRAVEKAAACALALSGLAWTGSPQTGKRVKPSRKAISAS